jgi:surface protein
MNIYLPLFAKRQKGSPSYGLFLGKTYRFFKKMGLLPLFFVAGNLFSQNPFITTWKTDNAGSSNSTSITIPTIGGGYNYDVDWNNDGTYDELAIMGDVTHDFGTAGTKTIRIRNAFPRIYFYGIGDSKKLLDISQWGDIAWTSMESALWGCVNLDISATDVPNLNGVTSLAAMFRGCTNLNSPVNIGTWNTSTVTDMNAMFFGADLFNQPINTWNTAAVTDMAYLFFGADSFNKPIGNWTLNPSVLMESMLKLCGMDCNNYSTTLIGWNANPATPNGRMLGAEGLDYENAALLARTNLTTVKGWTINGDALVSNVFYADLDNDGYGNLTSPVTLNTCSPPIGYAINSNDCDDACVLCFVGGTEICDTRDNDCDGSFDEGGICYTPPTITCPSNISVNTNPGECGKIVAFNVTSQLGTPITSISGFTYLGLLNGNTYFVSNAEMGWEAARLDAIANGGHLVTVSSLAENNLANAAGIVNEYMGLTDKLSEGNFIWITGEPVTYTNWSSDEPNNFQNLEHYGFFYADGTWNDWNEADENHYILELEGGIKISNAGIYQSFDFFPIGTTQLNYVATDGIGTTSSCSFTVTVINTTPYYADTDGDGFGNPNMSTLNCSLPGYVRNSSDCNDGNANINPLATEICNNIDDNCDNVVDNILTSYLLNSSDVPKTIPSISSSPIVVTSILTISGISGNITNLKLKNLNIPHSYVGDLFATLTSPGGTVFNLFDKPGVPNSDFGCNKNNILVDFDDAATLTAANFENACNNPPYAISGNFQPIDAFSGLIGTSPNGTWTLIVQDL